MLGPNCDQYGPISGSTSSRMLRSRQVSQCMKAAAASSSPFTLSWSSDLSKKQSNKPKREPSGFAKPTEISHELCDFLQKPYGTEMARTEVTKYLTQYIKQFNLQEPSDKRKINPDLKLSKLLGCESTDEVTYFNLQKWMKPHFSSAQTSTQ